MINTEVNSSTQEVTLATRSVAYWRSSGEVKGAGGSSVETHTHTFTLLLPLICWAEESWLTRAPTHSSTHPPTRPSVSTCFSSLTHYHGRRAASKCDPFSTQKMQKPIFFFFHFVDRRSQDVCLSRCRTAATDQSDGEAACCAEPPRCSHMLPQQTLRSYVYLPPLQLVQ